MAQQKSVAIALLEKRVQELEEENLTLVNENDEVREILSRIGVIVSDYDEDSEDLEDDEDSEDFEDTDFEDIDYEDIDLSEEEV